MIVGPLAFALLLFGQVFWTEPGMYGLGISWFLQLGIHGAAILLLSLGIVGYAKRDRDNDLVKRLLWSGVVLALIGLATVLPFLFAGFVLIGVATIMEGRRFPAAGLILGGVALLLVLASGGNYGDEGRAPLTNAQQLVSTVGLISITAAFISLGLRLTRETTAAQLP